MAKAPDLSPRALSLVDKLLARLPASVSDLETWWERQGKVTRLELRRILRQLDGDRLTYDRDAGTVKPMGIASGLKGLSFPATTSLAGPAEPSPQVRAAVSTRTHRHAGTSTPIITEKMLKASTSAAMPGGSGHGGGVGVVKASRVITTRDGKTIAVADGPTVGRPTITVTEAPTPGPAAPVVVPTVTLQDPSPVFRAPAVVSHVGGVTFTGSAAAVKAATEAYQRALLSPPTTPRPPAKPRQSKPVVGSVSERVRASVCRKPGTVGEVIARFPEVNENTIRGALGTLKAKGLVGHTGGKYGAPRG